MKAKSFLVYFYTVEIGYRIIYLFISFSFCLLISFIYIDYLILLEVYPFLKFSSHKKFLVTHTIDLITLIWFLTISTSLFTIFPLFFYQLIQFSKSSWYLYQLVFISNLFYFPLFNCYTFITLCYFFFFPLVLNFLIQWNWEYLKIFLNIQIELQILDYIIWILSIRYYFGFLIYFFTVILVLLTFLMFLSSMYKSMKFHRKKLCFLNILFIFILIPPDIYLQFIVVLCIFMFYEITFFYFCYKLCNTK